MESGVSISGHGRRPRGRFRQASNSVYLKSTMHRGCSSRAWWGGPVLCAKALAGSDVNLATTRDIPPPFPGPHRERFVASEDFDGLMMKA